jgi:uncharacterized protein YecE (DUF72 family)
VGSAAPVLGVIKETRRLRREARRAKQRAANASRAKKMHGARLEGEQQGNRAAIKRDGGKLPRFNVGCSGWFYWHWRGEFYAADLPTSHWFNHYTDHFRTVELNAPFYSWPTVGTVRGWMRQAEGRRFVYTVKVSELITHVKRFIGTKTLIRDFGHIADLLGHRMGCFLFQLPPSFQYTGARLSRILSQLDPTRRNVVEFRHRSWWNDKVFAAFSEHNIMFCSCSAPGLPDELVKTSDEIYVRFHGINRWYRHNYSDIEIARWAKRISSSRVNRLWAYFNNDRDGHAILNARTLLRFLRNG